MRLFKLRKQKASSGYNSQKGITKKVLQNKYRTANL